MARAAILLLALACAGLAAASFSPLVNLPGEQNIKTQIKASRTGVAVVAWVQNNQVFATILDVNDLAQGNFGNPVQLSQQPLSIDDNDEALHVNIAPQGSAAWVIWTRPSLDKDNKTDCQVEGRLFDGINQVWRDIHKIKTHVDDGKGACSLPGMTSVMRADGQRMSMLLFEPQRASIFTGGLQRWDWDGNKWEGTLLCCQNPSVFVSSTDGHYTIMASDSFEEIYIAWVNSNSVSFKIDAQRFFNGKWIIENEISIPNDAQIFSSFGDDIGILTVNLGSQIDIMTWTLGGDVRKYNSKVVVAPQTTNIISAFAGVSESGHIMATFMAFDPDSQTSAYFCETSVSSPKCNTFANKDDYVLYSDDSGSQNDLALFSEGGIYGAVYARSLPAGNTSDPSTVLPSIGGTFGYADDSTFRETAVLFASNASLPLCEASLAGTIPNTRGEVVVVFSGKFCNDGCDSCFTPTYTAMATVQSMSQNANNDGYVCSPQLKCVRANLLNVVSQFPTKATCETACEDDFLAPGFECSSSGKCVASKEAPYPTADMCSAACMPLPPSKNKISAGGVILLIFFVGLVFPYFIVGTLYNKLSKGAAGFEAVPHHEFWSSLPGLIRDGFAFVTTCGSKSASTYQQI